MRAKRAARSPQPGSPARRAPYAFMWALHPDVLTMTASVAAASNVSIVRLAISIARAWSPPCAFSAPQQPWPDGASTSQPLRARTRAVARL